LNNPDIALSYCGLGLVMYNVEEWEYALRCFLMVLLYIYIYILFNYFDFDFNFNFLGKINKRKIIRG
jgi:hypothetical protein